MDFFSGFMQASAASVNNVPVQNSKQTKSRLLSGSLFILKGIMCLAQDTKFDTARLLVPSNTPA